MHHNITELETALRQRLAIVGDEQSRLDTAGHMRRLRAVSETIEEIETRLAPTIDAQLRHFLQRRSYSKALEFIESM